MLDSLITNKTRLKLLLKFFLNKENKSYLRHLESEFGESTNAIRLELNRFESAGLLTTEHIGNKKYFRANSKHPLFTDINSILRKTIGIDRIVEQVTTNIGDLKETYLVGDLAMGRDSGLIDLLLIGEEIDRSYVAMLIEKAEIHLSRKIRYLILSSGEKEDYLKSHPALLIWNA